MKKKIAFVSILYYILYLLLYVAVFYVAAKLLKTNNLAEAVVRAALLLFVLTPLYVAVCARFSLLKWYVDPIVAVILPLFFYVGMLINQWKYANSFHAAFSVVNQSLGDDGGTGWIFLVGLFLFGLIASISPARKNGKSISYKLLGKITEK